MLHLIYGCMFAGKTTALMKQIQMFKTRGAKCLVITHEIDTRYSEGHISTHDNVHMKSVSTSNLMLTNIVEYDAIFIDEAQFFYDLVPFAYLCRKHRKFLCVAGLNANFRGELFGEMHLLLPHATSLDYLTATCKCGKPAMYSKRISDGNELVNVHATYAPVCHEHRGSD